MTTTRIHRRTLLRSITGTIVGLPVLEEMFSSAAIASEAVEPPVRAFNVFFGLGIPSPLQSEGYDGVLEPLSELKDKLLIMRGVDHVRCDQSGINAHYDGASAAFTATPPNGEARAGGASIDQVVRRSAYPNGQPAGVTPTLVAGTFFRRSRVGRFVHSYNADGSVAATIQERPRDLFSRVFGSMKGESSDESETRMKQSVLDAVTDQYKYFCGPTSPLGNASRQRIADHLDRVREYEQRAFADRALDPDENRSAVKLPPASKVAHGGKADPGGEGLDMALDELTHEWRLMADLYALAVEMDRVRFGSLTFLAAGERLRMTGDYHYNNEHRFTFNDSQQLGAGGSGGCSHEFWHRFTEKKKNEALRAHAHMKMREVAYFLKKLDAVQEPNGKSILQNSMLTISTESGDGRHSDVKRELSGVFHAITEANGRFKSGKIIDAGREGIDIYNTMLQRMGAQDKLGPDDRELQTVESILA
ncbi:hypothetical protein Pla22_34650 [Rubripirellula amarantea]|uniref:Secreted protein containing DUF1552 n=1 Tax=Rubripirellula amarantea TaxID=2527999 RepID=A0A5C5WLR6_9BACT|nr:DUF1552 domain-containing protein [Rubripirellula amarantea]TWT50722.1 hypothetical protein Pla22_34650 [Rubripirellula amarantea]